MELVGLDYADIQIDTDGQPIARQWGFFSCTGYGMLVTGYQK